MGVAIYVFFCCRYGGESLSEDHAELSITCVKLAHSIYTCGWALGHQKNRLDYMSFSNPRGDGKTSTKSSQLDGPSTLLGRERLIFDRRKATGER